MLPKNFVNITVGIYVRHTYPIFPQKTLIYSRTDLEARTAPYEV